MFKAGVRTCPQMQAAAQNLSESDIRTLAVFFSKHHPPLAPTSVPPTALVRAGKQLAETGVGTSVQACFSCHGAGGKGNGTPFPSIAGEPAAFTIARLHEFQARAKSSTPEPGSMTAVAASPNDTQIEQVARLFVRYGAVNTLECERCVRSSLDPKPTQRCPVRSSAKSSAVAFSHRRVDDTASQILPWSTKGRVARYNCQGSMINDGGTR
jgi:cytochrome c553